MARPSPCRLLQGLGCLLGLLQGSVPVKQPALVGFGRAQARRRLCALLGELDAKPVAEHVRLVGS